MTLQQVLIALLCVSLISIGQMLFRMVGLTINASGNTVSYRALVLATVAFTLYGIATVAWIHLLRTVPLSKAYPYMALSFCIVPLLGAFIMQEKLSATYPIGVVLIVAGVLLVGRAS